MRQTRPSELYEGCLRVFPASPLRLSLFAASNLFARTRAHRYIRTRAAASCRAQFHPRQSPSLIPRRANADSRRRASPRRDVCRGMPRGISQRRSIVLPIAFYNWKPRSNFLRALTCPPSRAGDAPLVKTVPRRGVIWGTVMRLRNQRHAK
jgi:hypothetical protein